MRLKAVLGKIDFVPMVKHPRMWISPVTLHNGSILEVEPEIGYQLMAVYPGCFIVIKDEEIAKKRTKKIDEADLVHAPSASEFSIVEG